MKIVHIESGLGNQMLSFCEYLVLKQLHPEEEIYIETIVYNIPECNEVICQWNGYELERIFGIKAPNIEKCFTDEQWEYIMSDIRASEFWDKNWNYPVHFTNAFNHAGLKIHNLRGDFEIKGASKHVNMKKEHILSLREQLIDTYIGDFFKRYYRFFRQKKIIAAYNRREKIFFNSIENVFTGQWLGLKYQNNGMNHIETLVRQTFTFPEFTDKDNKQMAEFLHGCNAVAIHARRGDLLGVNGYCYKYGYFRRAVNYIRKHVDNPVFVFFTNTGSVEWCKQNEKIFGLNLREDKVYFVDWNKNLEAYRDMQLMAYCKHAIITNSSFGWWGAFFINNCNKITISPMQEIMISTTHHC